ncbi:type IV pilus modification protein PilV [Gammaproteobacteria bacterium 45_16_T64]|nr:type IV pilus modification protein PilV [Gammaproteobacteria bacterium 45_16_T64]
MPHKLINRAHEKGVTLIEVLVTMIIIAIGLMGAATLQVTSLGSSQSAYFRSQASILAYDMADRLRGNADRVVASSDFDNFSYTGGSVGAVPGCISQSVGCGGADLSDVDKLEWSQSLAGSSSKAGAFLLPGAEGSVTRKAGSNVFTVSVNWVENDWDESTGNKAIARKSFDLQFTIEQSS